jgi:type VI protein secretion system component VasK
MVLSLPKILGLFALIWLVWMTFRFIEARQKNLADQPLNKNRDAAGAAKKDQSDASVDLQECIICGAWVSGETCDRENCPY